MRKMSETFLWMCEIEHTRLLFRERRKKMSDVKTQVCFFQKFFFLHFTVVTN